jgi:hypothetical protein
VRDLSKTRAEFPAGVVVGHVSTDARRRRGHPALAWCLLESVRTEEPRAPRRAYNMRKTVVAVVSAAMLSLGASMPALAKSGCPRECKKEFSTTYKSCKSACRPDTGATRRACKATCKAAFKNAKAKCKTATAPTFPTCSPSGAFVE